MTHCSSGEAAQPSSTASTLLDTIQTERQPIPKQRESNYEFRTAMNECFMNP